MKAHTCKRAFRGQLLAIFGLLLGLALPASASASEPMPFGHACKAENGVRFCPTVALNERVPTWDGVPIDVDVTLPPTGSGPWPTIAALHGWGTKKTEFETFARSLAEHGYAVMTDSHRGWGRSCGSEESREKELPPGSSCALPGSCGSMRPAAARNTAASTFGWTRRAARSCGPRATTGAGTCSSVLKSFPRRKSMAPGI